MLSIVAAGVLALPALLVQVVTAPIVAILSLPALCILRFRKPSPIDCKNAHVIITGGSSGIGLSIAQESVQRGVSKVTILARTASKLQTAKKLLEGLDSTKKVTIEAISVDVSDCQAMEATAKKLLKAPTNNVFVFCCAGESHPKYFLDNTSSDFERIIQTNQLGSIYTAKAFLPLMTSGTICFCSSFCGQIGIFGFSSYVPSKFAVRGFAEALHMEYCHSAVHIQVAYPPDTDTPGFEEENKSKPEETRLISEQAGLASPQQIARVMVKEAMQVNPRFNVYFTFEGWMLTALSAGMAPVSSLGDAVTQVALMSLFRLVGLFYLNDWWRIIRRYKKERETKESKVK